jgi:hypothetical protein
MNMMMMMMMIKTGTYQSRKEESMLRKNKRF